MPRRASSSPTRAQTSISFEESSPLMKIIVGRGPSPRSARRNQPGITASRYGVSNRSIASPPSSTARRNAVCPCSNTANRSVLPCGCMRSAVW